MAIDDASASSIYRFESLLIVGRNESISIFLVLSTGVSSNSHGICFDHQNYYRLNELSRFDSPRSIVHTSYRLIYQRTGNLCGPVDGHQSC